MAFFEKKQFTIRTALFSMWLIASFCILLSACVKENDVPAYLYIPSITLTTTQGQGTAAHKITDAWVYVDGLVQGIYQLPAQFPVVNIGKHDIQIFPGVRNNGIKSNPVIYPFLSSFKVSLDLKSGKIDTLRPTTTYISSTNFKILENFDSGNTLNVDRDNAPSIRFSQVDNGFEGKCAGLTMTKVYSYFEKGISTKVQLPDNSQSIYLEMHYKSQSPLSVGLFGTSATNSSGATYYIATYYPSESWNKVYINMTNEAKNLRMTDFQIVFKSLMPDSLSTASVLIDNIKLLQR